MAKKAASLANEKSYYLTPVALDKILPINVGVSSAQESTMISLLGAPQLPLTTTDQPEKASTLVKALKETKLVSAHVRVTGIRPAIASLSQVLQRAITKEADSGHDLDSVLATEGMLNVRYRKPTDGSVSKKISNHSWGTAIDFTIVGEDAPGNTHGFVPRFVAVLVPFFNDGGWYSGIGFHDTMHFEVADETIRSWASHGDLKP